MQRTTQQQQQQQQQLPPDQQAELDNSLNVLGLAVLKLWQHIVHAKVVYLEDVQSQTDNAAWLFARRTPRQVAYIGLPAYLSYLSRLAEHSLRSWPLPDAAAAAGSSSSSGGGGPTSSSSGSSRDMVRYGKVLLPKLQVVCSTDALPAALVTAQEIGRCIDETHSWDQETGESESERLGAHVFQLGDRSVLRLQLVLLAFQAKLLRKDRCLSHVRCLQSGASLQQQQQQGIEQQQQASVEQPQQPQAEGGQQQQQQPEEDEDSAVDFSRSDAYMNHLHLPGDHQLLLSSYVFHEADLAALEQQHLAGMHHVT
jgi:hypothetical protein